MPKIAIVGAGLTGLSLAYNLEKNGFFDYEIFESEPISGGLLKSVTEDGFTFDHTGHFLHISNPLFAEFLEDVLGFGNCNKIERASYVYTFDRYVGFPFQQNIGFLPPDVAYECLQGFVERGKSTRSVSCFKDWVLKYFGKGIGKHFFFPYNQKLLNLPPSQIMPSWTSRFVPETNLRTIFNSLIGIEEGKSAGYNFVFHYPKQGGIYSLIQGILRKIKKKIRVNCKLEFIDKGCRELSFSDGSVVDYQYLVTTIPLPHTLKILGSSRLNFSSALDNLRCNSVFNFNLGVNKKSISDKHWVYFPEKKFKIYRMGFWHNFSKNMAPEGMSSLYGEYSFLNQDKNRVNFERVVDQVVDFLGLSEKDIILRKDLVLEYAYVVYDRWREDNLKKIHSRLNSENIYSSGRFGEWKYSSMQEAFLDGLNVSEQLLRKLNFSCVERGVVRPG